MGEGYKLLTDEGIRKLVQGHFNAQYKLQIKYINITPHVITLVLSDGYAWLKGKLGDIANDDISTYKTNELMFAVIGFRSQDFKIIEENEFILNHITSIDLETMAVIGSPVPYKEYVDNQMKNSLLMKSSSKAHFSKSIISTDKKRPQRNPLRYSGVDKYPEQYLYIGDVKLMQLGVVKRKIRAKIIKKPDTIKAFMIITLEDAVGERIQCCSFADVALYYLGLLHKGCWYLFENTILQISSYTSSYEVKLTCESIITDEKGIILSSNKKKVTQTTITTPSKYPWTSFGHDCKEFDMIKALNMEFDTNQYYFIVAYVITKKNNQSSSLKGRVYGCITANGECFQILFWSDCDAEIMERETYKFVYMRAKVYKGKISLYSNGKKTRVIVHPQKIVYIERKIERFQSVERQDSLDNKNIRKIE